jgi:hypothetical protein
MGASPPAASRVWVERFGPATACTSTSTSAHTDTSTNNVATNRNTSNTITNATHLGEGEVGGGGGDVSSMPPHIMHTLASPSALVDPECGLVYFSVRNEGRLVDFFFGGRQRNWVNTSANSRSDHLIVRGANSRSDHLIVRDANSRPLQDRWNIIS